MWVLALLLHGAMDTGPLVILPLSIHQIYNRTPVLFRTGMIAIE